MSALWDLIAGKNESTSSSGTQVQTSTRGPTRAQQQSMDMLARMILGQQTNPPETAIGVPFQQAVSLAQGLTPRIAASASGELGLAGRLAGPAAGTAPNFLGSSWTPGADQAGLQTREQLGLPPRKSYFSFLPTEQDIRNIGIPPVHSATRAQQKNPKNTKARKDLAAKDRAG